jgi:energy-coupling factor transporter ATP-binding protein EcfA2
VLLAALGGLIRLAGVEVVWRVATGVPATMALQYPEQQVFEERVEDELVYAACQRGLTRDAALARARAALEMLGFPPEMSARRTWDLSTGVKRLVEVTAALIAPAGAVLLDEPTAGLDPPRRAALGRLIAERAREPGGGGASTPVVIATQDRAWAVALGARVVDLGAPTTEAVVDGPDGGP